MSVASHKAESFPFSRSQHKNCARRKRPEKFPAAQRLPGILAAAADNSAPTNSVPAQLVVPARFVAAERLPFQRWEAGVAAAAAQGSLPEPRAGRAVLRLTQVREMLCIPTPGKIPAAQQVPAPAASPHFPSSPFRSLSLSLRRTVHLRSRTPYSRHSPRNNPHDGGCRSLGNPSVRPRLRLPRSGNRGRPDSISLPFLIAERVAPNLHYCSRHQHLLPHWLAIHIRIANRAQHDARTCQLNNCVFLRDVAVLE